jgi:hypothetical protein
MIKLGMCVAYDWPLLKVSLPRLYPFVDTIVLSRDKDQLTWSGEHYEFDHRLFSDFINDLDKEGKISLLEESFYNPSKSPIENDNAQRTAMAARLGQGGWHLQVDADEYFLDAEAFVAQLKKMSRNPEHKKPVNIVCPWISLIKKLDKGFLYVYPMDGAYETTPIATNAPVYTNARRNGHFNYFSASYILHDTWARQGDQLYTKLRSWGHSSDFNIDSYFALWQSLDEHNFKYILNFHPLSPALWPALGYIPANSSSDLIRQLPALLPEAKQPWGQNSRLWAKIKFIIGA